VMTASGGHGSRAVSLSRLADGTRARLARVDAGLGLRARLMAMGLRPGVEVKVVSNRGAGPFVVAAGSTRIVLGRGMAHKVYAIPLDEGSGGAAEGSSPKV